jgi:alpha-galactosidase
MLLEWELDYLKYDNCYPRLDGSTNIESAYIDFAASATHFPSLWQDPPEETRYAGMAAALAAVRPERNITFELCAWGFGNVETFGPRMGHLWRTGPDISDSWDSLLWNIDINDEERFRGPGVQGPGLGWNYPDALFVGKGGMTNTEYRTMFALWSLAKAPLMLGVDLTTLTRDSEAYSTITNPGLLAVNQDPLGRQGTCVRACCSHGSLGGLTAPQTCHNFHHSWQVWTGPLEGDAWVVVLVNRFDKEESITMDWQVDAKLPPGRYELTDLWHSETLGNIQVGGADWEGGKWKGILEPHDNWAFRLQAIGQ